MQMRCKSNVSIKVVENQEELLKAFIIRGIVYMHEQECPYDEEFDLNDYSATQVIGSIDGEPVLTARIRYLGDTVKLERLAIRSEYRGSGYGHELLQFLLRLCRSKGATKFYLHAQKRLVPFYEGYGFKPLGKVFGFSDHEYVEMFVEMPATHSGLRIGDDPMIMNRPEGRLAESGPLEKSVARMCSEREVVRVLQ